VDADTVEATLADGRRLRTVDAQSRLSLAETLPDGKPGRYAESASGQP